MKVNSHVGSSLKGVELNQTNSADSKKELKNSELATGETKDSVKVNLSDRAHAIQKAKEIAGQADTVDEAKVARLQKLIDEGNYNVDAASVADRLVDEHLMFPE